MIEICTSWAQFISLIDVLFNALVVKMVPPRGFLQNKILAFEEIKKNS